jgi:hypothetical protein
VPKSIRIDVKIDGKIDAKKYGKLMPELIQNDEQIYRQLMQH